MTTVTRIVAFTVPKPSEHAPPTAKPCDSGQCSDWNAKSQEYGFSTAEPCDSRHFSDTTIPKPKEYYAPSTAKPCDSCHFSSTNLPKPKENTHSKIDCQKSGSGRENRNVENLVKDSNFFFQHIQRYDFPFWIRVFGNLKRPPPRKTEGMCSIHGERCDRGHFSDRNVPKPQNNVCYFDLAFSS